MARRLGVDSGGQLQLHLSPLSQETSEVRQSAGSKTNSMRSIAKQSSEDPGEKSHLGRQVQFFFRCLVHVLPCSGVAACRGCWVCNGLSRGGAVSALVKNPGLRLRKQPS